MDYMASAIEKIIVERAIKIDSAILGEIKQIAVENGIETKIILNEKNIAEALRNYQNGYADIKTEVAREIFEEIDKNLDKARAIYRDQLDINGVVYTNYARAIIAELKKKYTEGK